MRSTGRRLLVLLGPLALIFASTGCVTRGDDPPVGAYRSTEGFDARVNKLAAESARSIPQRIANQIRAGELPVTMPSIRSFIAAIDPTPRDTKVNIRALSVQPDYRRGPFVSSWSSTGLPR